MDLDSWTTQFDATRFRRMLFGGGVGFVSLSAFFAALAWAAPEKTLDIAEEITEITLAESPEAPDEPDPEPDAVDPVDEVVQQAGPRLASLRAPIEIPDEKPREADPSERGDGAYDPYAATGGRARVGRGSGHASGHAQVAKPQPQVEKKPPPPRRAAPHRVTAEMTPPRPISQASPVYSDELKTQGIEGVVVMKYVVEKDGSVPAAKPLSGPRPLAAICWAAMRTWRFEPAKDAEGNPVKVSQIARFSFAIETD